MRGRPQFVHLADSRVVFLNFLLAYAFTGAVLALARGQGAFSVPMDVFSWLFSVAALWLCFGRGQQSKVLLGSMFAAMAGYDLLEITVLLAFDLPAQGASAAALAAPADSLRASTILLNSGNPLQTIVDGSFALPPQGSIVQEAGSPFSVTLLSIAMSLPRMVSIILVDHHFRKMPGYVKAAGYRPE